MLFEAFKSKENERITVMQEWLEKRGFHTTAQIGSLYVLTDEGRERLREVPLDTLIRENAATLNRTGYSLLIKDIVYANRVVVVAEERLWIFHPGNCPSNKTCETDCTCIAWATRKAENDVNTLTVELSI